MTALTPTVPSEYQAGLHASMNRIRMDMAYKIPFIKSSTLKNGLCFMSM